MTDASKSIAKKIQLLAKKSNGSQDQQNYEITAGAGDAGAPLRVKAQSATRYELLDPKTERAPQHVRAKRSGRDLEIFLDGSETADIVIEQYYDEGIVEFPKDSLTGITDKGDVSIYVIDEGLRPAMSTLEAHVTPITLLENAAWFNPWWGIAGVAAFRELQSDSGVSAPAAPTAKLATSSDTGVSNTDRLTSDNTPTLEGTGTAGDTITVKDAHGNVIATAVVAVNGTWSATPTAALVDGVYDFSITESSPGGQTSPETHLQVTIAGDLTITGSVTAGPVSAGVTLTAYDNTGALLGTATIQSDGTFSILAPNKGAYRGAVLLKAVDSNASGTNYLDEVTAANKSLGSSLRAMGVAEAGQAQFTIQANDATLVIHITPVTELAVLKAGITTDSAPASASFVLQVNQAIANVLGLNGVDITAQPVATNSAGFDASNGLSTSEKYGLLLTKLSGLDSLNGGSLAISLMQLAQNINTSGNGTLTAEGAALVDQGRQQALTALKNAPSSAEKTFAIDTVLNRQLLGDVIVQSQTLNANGLLEVSGIALPGSTVQVTFPDGTTQSVVANSAGQFTLASAAVQATLEIPLKVTGADGLSQPAALVAPAAPVVETGNGKIVSGTGTPGSTVTVKDALGQIVGSAVVDALGQWSFVPTTPLADNAVLRASAVDSSGNVSGPAAGTVDVDRVSVRLAEAADGYINAAEKASGGISFDIGLPAMAQVGDTISTVVTLPNGNTLTLVDVLTAAQVAAGAITRTLTPAQLATDGLYNAAISLVTQVGQSAPVHQSFIVDATAPAAPVVSPSNGQIINGTAEVGTTVTVTDGAGHVIGTVGPVGPDGNWTLLPAQPLPNGTALSATATDVAGNTSGPGANSVDTNALLITGAIDSVGPQLGLLADGSATNDTSPQFAGSLGTGLQPGQTLVVYRQLANGTAVKVGTADVNGTAWTFQDGAGTGLNAPLADGNYTWQVVVETAAGPVAGLTPSGYFDLTVNTVRPAAPATAVPEATGSDTFVSAAEKATDGGVPIVTQLAAGARVGDVLTTTVTLPDGSTRVLNTTLTVADIQAGHVSQLLTQSALVTDGAYSASTTITSAINGLVSAPTTNHFTLDTSALAAGTGALATASDTGTLGDNTTNDNTPALSGTAEAGASVQIVVNGQTYTTTANAQGVWSLPATATLPDGSYTPVITVTDAAGNSSTANGTPFTVDASAPSAPAVALPEAANGINAAEAASLGGTPIVTTLPADAKVGDTVTTVVTNPNGTTSTLTHVIVAAELPAAQGGTATGAGPFTISQVIPSSTLTVDGAWTTRTTLTDTAGNTSPATAGGFTLDTLAPATGTGALAAASDTGTLGDNTTNDNTPALSGTAEAGASVQIVVGAQTYTVTANAQGVWSLPATATLPDGTYTPVITVTDAAGNSSAAVNGTPFTVDASAPAAPGVTIPDASRGVNATEASDGVALVVSLPNDAVAGDTLTTVVTKPDGTTLTLTRVLTAADITAGQYSQTVPQTELLTSGSTTQYRDGAWTTSTTLIDTAGNTSQPQTDGFALSANGPALTLSTVAGDGTVNALEKTGDLPLSGTTTAEAGQAVTVQLLDASNNVIGTFYTVVQPNGTFALNIPQAQLPADGAYTLTANVSNFAGTPAAQQTRPVLFDTTAPTISVTSVAGDAVSATGSGTFDGTERGFNLSDYTLSNTVTTPPVLSGTTTAEVGQTVNVLFNQVSYTATVQAGTTGNPNTWSVALTQDEAKALVHGTTYAITASVSDVAGNPSLPDIDNHLVVNIAPPDVPTVNLQYTGTTTPVITGTAQKLNGANAIALAAGDTLVITLNGVTVTATIQASGTATDIAGVTYDPATKTWSLATATAGSFGLADDHIYNVAVSTSTAGGTLTRSDISAGELVIDTTPPTITLNPISPDGAGASVINGFEQNQAVTLTGTTTAQVGSTVTLTGLGGQTYTATVQAGTNGLNTFSIPVTGTDITALTDGTYTPTASVTNLFGLTGTDTESLIVDTNAPSAPTVALPEALGGINAAEALSNSGTPLVVTLPVDAAVGDTVTTLVTNPDGTVLVLTHVIVASELPAAQGGTGTGTGPFTVTQTIPSSALTVDGPWTTRTTVTDTAGNASVPQTASFTLDTAAPGVPGVALPEALNGVSAAEALSNGGTPINVTLPGDALVGDTVTTVVTLPTGGTLTLSHVLTAADIAAGSIGQLIPTSALTQDGTWSTSTTVTDLAGNTSAPRTGSFVLDTTPPAAPAAALATASDTGTLGDSTTADNTPSISGTGTPGDTITVTFPGGEVKTAVVAADGTWSVTPTTPLTDGVNTVTITATDPAGNVSTPTALPLTIDTTAPVAPTAALAAVSDTGTLGDSLTNDNTPTLSGNGVPGDTITIKNAAGNVIATAVVAPNGTWAATPTTALPDGLNALSVTATDPAGNTGPAVALPITIDTGAPAAPAAALAVASDSGTLGDAITSDNTPTVQGTGTPGDTITVTFPGGEVKTVVVGNTGSWSLTPTNPLVDGLNNITVTATDPAGNTSPATTVPVTIDTTPPAAPGADVAAASDTGASNTDNITSDTTPTISGAGATPGDTIKLYAPNGTTVLGTAVVAADGSWAITPTTPLAEGLSTLSVTATDPAGNTSAATPVPVTIDTTAPAAPTVAALTTNDSTPVITGTATLGAGETLTVTVNGATYNVTVGVGGVWSLNTSAVAPVSGTLGAFVDGQTYPVTATVTDAAGNATSDATTSELVFDTTAPSVPTVNTMATNDGTPVITGTANLLAGETLTVTVNGATYNVTVATNGTWRLDTGATTPASGTLGAFVNGTSYPVVATITDLAHNATSDTSTNELRFDTTPPDTPAGDVAAISDTGISNTDNITSDTTPTIVGTGTAGDTITLYAPNGTTVLGTAVVDAAGNWSITSTALPQGTSALQVTATDPAGNTSAPGTVSVTIDTTAPAAPAAVLDASSDTGLLGDSLTKDNTPTLSGTGEPDATITIKDAAGNTIATATVASDGSWSATPTTALPNGLNTLSVTATDPAGNVSQPTALPITIDTTAPAAPAAALASSSDTGILGDAKTADTTPTISGTGTPGDTITVKDGSGNVIATATVAPDGSWSATPTTPLADGLHNLAVTATDPAGNTGPATTVPVTIDATAPAAPSPDVAAASDTGSSNTDNLTSDTTPTISGTGAAGDTITLYAPNGTTVLGTAVVDATGHWAITPTTALPDGTTALSVKATDPQGNTSAPGTVSVTIDTTAPAAPTAMLDSGSDTGNLGDSKTNDTTPTLSGMGVPGDTITVKNAAGTVIATATVAGDGTWSATPTTALPEGLNTLSITATDPAGNTSLPTALPVTIDTTVAAPVIAPSNGAGAVTGTGEPGATVTVSAGGTILGTAVVDASGHWSVPVSTPLANSTALSATQTDLAGNASTPGTSTVDTTMPNIAPTNGTVITGTGTPGDTIALTLPDGTVLRNANGAPLTAVVAPDGTWTATPGAPLPDGTTLVATDTTTHKTGTQVVDATPPSAPVASLALASDTGTVGDGVTQDTTPTLSGGGASPGDTIQLYAPNGTTLLGTAVVAPDGTWSITVPTALADGTHNFKLTATDPVGNTSAATTLPVTIDTSAPVAPAAALATTSDSGTVGDGITSDNTPTLTGTGTPGDTITIKDAAGNTIATAVVGANGSWTATPTSALPDGVNNLQITATDPAGNTGPAASLPLTIDTTAPVAPAAVLATVSDSGTLGDSTTNDTTPTLSGTGTVGDTITVKDAAGNVIATAVVGAGGTWTATPTTPLPEGTSTLAITATDKAGNTGPATSLPITIDTTGPAAPAAALASVSDSGKLGDSTTTDTTPTLTGTGMPGDTITVKNAAGTVIATATVGTDGTWTATPTTALPEGVNALSVTATDPAGNTGPATALPITIDTTAPAAPAAALALVSDSGTVGDSITSDNTPTLTGTGTPGDTITIKDAAGNVLATAVVAANGSWSATTPTLPDGVNALSVTATDPAGNTSAPTALPITVDTSVGAVSIAASNGVGAITGTGEPGATLKLVNSATGAVIGTVTVAPNGSWSVPLSAALPDGTALSATQTDAAGNTSSPATDTINTAIPVLAPSNGSALTGTGKPGDTIAITVNGVAVLDGAGQPLTAVVDTNGNWTAVPGTPIANGATVLATDTASGLTDSTVVDSQPPAVPLGVVATASDTGTVGDSITADNTPTITGTGTPGDTIKLYAPNGTTLLGTAVVAADGSWAITPTTALADGVQALKLNATDPLGNTSAQSTVSVTIDTAAPAAPVAALTSGSDSGTPGDNTTNVTTPTLSGTGEPGATISIKDAAGNVLATATVAANGSWSATTTTLPEGTNALRITATDAAGNTSPATPLTLVIDTVAPAQPAAPDLTAATDTGASSTDNLTNVGTPAFAVTAPPAGGSVVLYVDGTAVAATYNASTGTVTPTVALTDGAHAITYKVVDAAGNASTASTALSVTIDTVAPAQPAAPDLTAATDSGTSPTDNTTNVSTPAFAVTAPPAGGSVVMYVDGTAVAATYNASTGTLTPTVALTDATHVITYKVVDAAGNASTASAPLSVTIDTTAPAAPGGILAAISDSGTLGDSITSDATPTITGTGTAGDTITLKDAAGNVIATATVAGDGSWSATPTASLANGTQTLHITATDPAGNVSPASDLPLTIVNSPTVFSGTTALAITESNAAQTVSGTLGFSDPDGPTTITALTNAAGTGGYGTFTTNASTGAWSYTMNTAQDALTAGQVVTDTITVSAADGSSQVLSVTITGTNDQPEVVANDNLTTLEDAPAPVNGVTQGTLVSSLYLANYWHDAEGTVAGMAFVSPKTQLGATPAGVAWYSIDNGATWLNLGTAIANASLTHAFVLDSNARLYYQGAPNANGTLETSSVRLWDGTDFANPAAIAAASGTYKDISALTTATGAYSASNTAFTFHVTGVNDAPVNTLPTGPLQATLNVAKVITGLQISDVDAGSTSMTVTLAVDHGTLTLVTGTGVTITGSGTGTVTLAGTLDNLNALLVATNAVTYTPTTGFLGSDTLTMKTNDNFVGNQWNTGTALTDTDTLAIDIKAEVVNVAITNITTDSGISNTDHITNDNTPTISGTSDQFNRPLTLTIAGVTFSVMTDGSGNWSVDTGALTPTSGTYNKAVGFADGVKAISVSVAGTKGGSATATSSVTIDTAAPTVLVTSVFGDAVAAAGNGTFDVTERGFNTTNYTLSSTVTPLPVISGTTTAEDGQTVTVTLAGKTYTVAASGGTWSVQVPSNDAVLLNHGNTYAISASVSDKAGNAAVADTNNGVLVNIAPPDVPTVVSQTTLSTTPTITGVAKKLNGTSTVSLDVGDVLTVVVKDAAGTTTLGTYTLTVNGTNSPSSPAGLSYTSATGAWSLAVPASVLPATLATYNIDVSATAGGITRSDISSSELKIVVAPTITSIPEGPVINMVEAASVGGTPVNVGIAGTGAVAGQVITVNWGTQTFTQVLTATDITNGTVAIVVPTATLQAQTATNTSGSVPVSVSLGNGVTSAVTTETVNFVTPAAPIISNTLWSTTNTTSTLLGIPEANYSGHGATFASVTSTNSIVDNKLYYNEAIATADAGTVVRVQLPVATGAVNPPVVGDTLTIIWGDQTLSAYTLTATDITTNKFVDITVPFATIDSQAFGNVIVKAVVTSAVSGNSSAPATVTVDWSFDLPLDNLTAMSAGFAINGGTASSMLGYVASAQGAMDVGDVNGDGFDDFDLVDLNGVHYVVYGKAGLTTVEVSSMSVAGNTNGYTFNTTAYYNGPAGDINGDGLNDVVMQNTTTTAYVVLGNTRSPGAMTTTTAGFTISNGFTITSPTTNIAGISVVGDVNGDGYDDVLINFNAAPNSAFLLYGSSSTDNVTLPTGSVGTYSNGYFINNGVSTIPSGGVLVSASGDFNGDGYSDFVQVNKASAAAGTAYVHFGGSALTSITTNTMSVAGTGRGFSIQGLTDTAAVYATTGGDVNGDGLADILINDGVNAAYVVFGKTSDAPVNVSSLAAGVGGFKLIGQATNGITDVAMVGDFNGDGLADMLVSEFGMPLNSTSAIGLGYLVYGRTSTTAITLSALAASEGFRINGVSPNGYSGYTIGAAGDVNGDGFADVLISVPQDDPSGRTNAGATRVVYGGVTRINDMVFQAANGDAIGTTGNDTLAGTSGANQLVGGDGNDTLIGAGGADVLYGGRGDDTLVIDASNIAALARNTGNTTQAIARVDGGTGTDTLQVLDSLDLTTIRPAAIQSIERINLFSTGTSLTIGLLDVLGLSEKNNPFNTATGWTTTTSGGAAGWGTVNNGAQVVVDGTNTNDLYLSGAWQSIGLVQHTETVNGSPVTKTYKVLSDLTDAAAQVLVDSNIKVHMAPTVVSTANELAGSLNLAEANSSGGTPVRINLVDTDAAANMTITLNWGGQVVTVTLTATDIANGYATLPLTTAQLTAETPIGTSENVAASVSLLNGSTVVAQSLAQPVAVNFVVPTTPTIDSVLWSATNITSKLAGIPEAAYSMDTTVMPGTTGLYVDNTLYYSEVVNPTNTGSTILRVQLPTVAASAAVPTLAGDTLTLHWGSQVITVGAVSATDITNKYVDVTIPQATLETQAFGNVVVSAEITSAASGNTSLTSPLTVKWAYDLPLAQLQSLSQGFQIEGNVSAGKLGVSNENQGAQNVGDVNGDGFDDLEMTDISGNRYVVYGGNRLGAVNVADFTAPGNTNGFMIASTNSLQPTRGGDINGDGLSDILIGNGTNSYIIFGKTTSIGKVTLAALGTNGFAFTSASSVNEPSVVGDVNGDGYEDMLFNNSSNFTNYLVFGGTNFTPGGSVAVPTGTSGTLATGTGAGTTYVQITNGGSFNSGGILSTLHGDFNGDGYSDFALAQTPTTGIGTGPVYVYYGSSSVTPWNSSALTLAGNGRGFQITGLTGQNSIKFETTNAGDVNGDGMDDIAFNDGTTRAYVLFGKTNSTSVSTTALDAGIGGFVINAGTNNANSVITDVDVVGDFNGDGLADMVVSNTGMYVGGGVNGGAYLIYGRTATTALTLDSLEVSQGFRISGYSSTTSMLLGRTATAAGDFNGDGFADLALTTYQGEATGMTSTYLNQAGITRIVYGGVGKLQTMTFQSANGDAIGTTGADTLTGTSGNNQLVAGDGNDTLIGNGGADVLYGGRGDDLIIVNADNVAKLGMNTGNDTQAIARVDGGAGIDTLRLDGGGIMLDLSLVSSPAIQNIEKIDLTGSGNNTLKLSLQDMLQSFDNSNVFNSSNTTSGLTSTVSKNQLMVDGNAGDKLVLSDLASWTAAGTNVVANGHTYVAYNHNTSAQQLLIDLNVQVSAT